MSKRILLYQCDPNKNINCSGANSKDCQTECYITSKEESAILGDDGKPIVAFDSENPSPIEPKGKKFEFKPPNTLYLCDPNKNTECKKTSCLYGDGKYQQCDATTKKEFAKLDENGEPILAPPTLFDL